MESSPDVYKVGSNYDLQTWAQCPPATIYLIVSVLSIVVSIFKGTLGLVESLVYAAVVFVVYCFFTFLCEKNQYTRIAAWVLIVLQLFGIAVQFFK